MLFKSDKYVQSDSSESEDEYEYAPPRHFKPHHSKGGISKNQVGDKQIWLIKHPKDFKFKVKKLPINFKSFKSQIEIEKKTYEIVEQLEKNDQDDYNKFQIFSGKDSKYTPTNLKINKMYNINEKVQIPNINMEKVKIDRDDVPKVSNLKMRHFPTGYDGADFGETVSSASELEPKKKDKKEKKEKKGKKDKKDKKKKDKK